MPSPSRTPSSSPDALNHLEEAIFNNDEDEVVKTFSSLIQERGGIQGDWKLYLFGSRARGTAEADSDYDFMVTLPIPARGSGMPCLRIQEKLKKIFPSSSLDIQVSSEDGAELIMGDDKILVSESKG